MSSTTIILLGVTYYVVAIIIVFIVLHIIKKKSKNYYLNKIDELEREKNLIISANILSELNKVESLVNNETLQQKYEDWQNRFNEIKDVEIPKLTDKLLEIEDLYNKKQKKELKEKLAKVEYQIYFVKTKSNYLLSEIKEITSSNERNRSSITKLKARYRDIISTYNNNKADYDKISENIDLQIDRIDKLFSAFEVAMESNNYSEVNKIVKVLDDILGNLKLVIEETPSILMMANKIIPAKIKDIESIAEKLAKEGYNLDYLNLEYNIEETNKKLSDILERLNVLNIEDSTLDLETIMNYFDGIYSSFDKEQESKKQFEEYYNNIISRAINYEKTNNNLRKKTDEFKYSYDLVDDDLKILDVIKKELKDIKRDYETIVNAYRSRTFAFSRLNKEMEILNNKLVKVKEKLDEALKSLGSLREDEIRAREQLEDIKDVLRQANVNINTYKLPVLPKKYEVELSEANEAIDELVRELNKKPISIKTLNIRVDTARDLVLKLYNTSKETVKSAYMAEMAVVYGNRFRVVDEVLEKALTTSESLFNRGEYKKSLENSINAINTIEPEFYNTLKTIMEGK